jgi:magnesium transporter
MRKKFNLRISNPQKVEFLGKKFLEKSEIQLIEYNTDTFSEHKEVTLEAGALHLDPGKVSWLNVHGLHDTGLIDTICSDIKMPRFIVQDILDTNQRTKMQDLGNYIFFSVKSILSDANLDFDVEQISFIVSSHALYSFQEKKGDHFEHVRVRIRENNGLVRTKGADFLLYLLIDGIIANYFTTIDLLEEAIRENGNPLENKDTSPAFIYRIEDYKVKLLRIRKNIVSLRDALVNLEKEGSEVIKKEQAKYFFDVKDSCLLLIESIDSMEQRLVSAENLFFSMQGHRMNQVMTTLTIMAAIFIPLTFIAGIYGMNFSNMPELDWEWGYFSLLGVMLFVTLLLIYYFKRRKWF